MGKRLRELRNAIEIPTRRWITILLHQALAKALGTRVSIGAILWAIAGLAAVAGTVVVPIFFRKITDVGSPYWQAGLLAFFQALKYYKDKFVDGSAADRELKKELKDLSVELARVLQKLEVCALKGDNLDVALGDPSQLLRSVLECIESTIKAYLKRMDSKYFRVTLLTFEANDKMMIRARAAGSEGVREPFDRSRALATVAATRIDEFMSVPHFKEACRINGRKPPYVYRRLLQDEKPPYESILFLVLPKTSVVGGSSLVRKGVVTINAAPPYEFHGQETEIKARVQPYLHLINFILSNHEHGVPYVG